jgi:cytochrome P450/NADPH-cytochrome P450 reductase
VDAESAKHATPLLVLFGSNSGTAEAFAAQVSEAAAAAGFAVTTATLDSVVTTTGSADAGAVRLPTNGAVLIITATYNGLPPDNAARFARALAAATASGSRPLEGVSYAVFGVGNSEWVQTFQAVPRCV